MNLRQRKNVTFKRLTKAEAAARQKAAAEAVVRMLEHAEPYLKLVKQPLGKP